MPRSNHLVQLPSTLTYKDNIKTNDGVYTTTNGSYSSETVSGTTRRKPKGWIPPTGYSLQIKKYRRDYGSVYNKYSGSTWVSRVGCIGGTFGSFNSLNNWDAAMTEATASAPLSNTAALIAARARMKNMKVDLGVAFAERKATSRMLGDTARRLALAARDLQRGSFRDAARRLGIRGDPGKPRGSNWTNHWLQLQYGWKPLLSDVYGSCDALSKREKSDWRVTAKASRRESTSKTYGPTNQGSTRNGDYSYACGVELRKGVFVRIDAIPDNDLKMSLSSLGVTNPLLVAWELVPYSFVVDWAFPVGNWLSSLDAMLGYTQAYTSTSYYNKCNWTSWGLSKRWSSTNYIEADFDGSKECLWHSRAASSGVPQAKPPGLKDPRSLGHMANGLALLAQAFARR